MCDAGLTIEHTYHAEFLCERAISLIAARRARARQRRRGSLAVEAVAAPSGASSNLEHTRRHRP